MKQRTLINSIYDYVENHHSYDCSGHDFEHIKRVYRLAQQIAATEPSADLFCVEVIALMHDLDDYKLGDEDSNNGEYLLESLSFPHAEIRRILTIIDSVGFSKSGDNPQLSSIEARILYDADKLDGMGAIGVARAFAYGGNKSRKLFDPQQFPERFELARYQHRSRHGGNHTINHFFDKLLKVESLMQTAEGRRMAALRQPVMVNFLAAFFAEQGDDKWLSYLREYLAGLSSAA